jgi:hypothetical protein
LLSRSRALGAFTEPPSIVLQSRARGHAWAAPGRRTGIHRPVG